MTTTRKGRRYLATVARGEAISLQGDKSDVELQIKEGCPKKAHLMEIRTDVSSFGSIIPGDECFISPIVNVLAPTKTSTSSYILRIPHCLDEDADDSKVKVRLVHENRKRAVVLVPERTKCTDGVLYYNIDDRFIELHTKDFCSVICTLCETPYHCRGRINQFWFARLDTKQRKSHVEIRPYFGGVLHASLDFRKVLAYLSIFAIQGFVEIELIFKIYNNIKFFFVSNRE